MIDYAQESWTLKAAVQLQFLHLQTFIESGSFMGGGIQQALDVGFQAVHSIELDDHHFAKVTARFQNDSRVKCWHGDSSSVLPVILEQVSTAALIFLDGHSNTSTPLIEELHVLAKCPIKHSFIIDDIDMILKRIGWGTQIELDRLFDALAKLPGYQLKVLDSKARKRSQWLLTPID